MPAPTLIFASVCSGCSQRQPPPVAFLLLPTRPVPILRVLELRQKADAVLCEAPLLQLFTSLAASTSLRFFVASEASLVI